MSRTTSSSDALRFGPRSSSGLGSLRFISFNTWLIVLNVLVFVLNNLVGHAPTLQLKESMGREYAVGVTAEQQRRGEVIQAVAPHPKIPGWFFRPIVDPLTVSRDAIGRVEIDPVTREPLKQVIGRDRFAVMPPLEALGHFSTGKAIQGLQVWRFITFQFLHYNWVHLLFNMMGLWFVGGMVEQHLGFKRYAAFYLMCGLCGGAMYLALNLIGYIVGTVMGFGEVRIPGLLFNDVYTPLIGASAGVFGVLIAAARLEPTATVYVYFLLPLKLKFAVLLLMGVTLFNLFTGEHNAGGEAAHVGGALAGYYFVRRLYLLRDFFDIVGDSRRPTGMVAGSGGAAAAPAESLSGLEAEVERILEKSHAEGVHSLTDVERGVLQRFHQFSQGTGRG